MSDVPNIMFQYGALGILGVIVYMIVRTQTETYRQLINTLNQITTTLRQLQDNQAQMIRALADITRRLENIERGGKI